MGKELYIGCYIEYDTVYEEYDEKEPYCNNCEKETKTAYCPYCGNPVEYRLVSSKEEFDVYDLTEDTEYYENLASIGDMNDLVPEGRSIALANLQYMDKEVDTYDLFCMPITQKTIDDHAKAFISKFNDTINYLQTKVKNLEVKFGVIVYWN